jgi:hypothetical protein
MKFSNSLNAVICGVLIVVTSCKKDVDTIPALVVPVTYDNASFTTNASTQINIVESLNTLTTEAKKGRLVSNKLSKATLDNLFVTGNPSLAGVATTYYKNKLEGTNGFFDEITNASNNLYTPVAPIPTSQGGVFGTGAGAYLFDENGLEMEQMIEKGQFGAVLYKHATDLIAGNITTTTTDQLLAIFGATPSFANSGSNVVAVEIRDKAMANYAARRDKNDGKGYYSQMKTQFIKLQAAVKAGTNYNKERDEALAILKLTWEKVNAATVINYCHAVISTLSGTTLTDNQKAAALHAYGECVGFIHGWRTIPQMHKKITDTQIDEILVLLNAPYNATPTSYKFVTDAVNELPKLTQIITKLKDIYGFSTQEIEDFKNNWVTIQNR